MPTPLLQPSAAQRYVDAFLNMQGVSALWPLWESGGMGTAYRDVSRNANHATIAGTVTPTTLSGSVGEFGLLPNGTTGYLEAPLTASLTVVDVFAISAVIVPGATGAVRAIFALGTSTPEVRLSATNQLNLLKANTALIVTTVALTTAVHHVVVTKSGATVKQYVDGVDVTGSVSNATMITGTQPARIAASEISAGNHAAAEFGNMRVAMVGLHNRLMTASEAAFLSALAFAR